MNYKTLKIDITQIFINEINRVEWTNHYLTECEKFSSLQDDFVNITVNGVEYELLLKFHIKCKATEIYRKDIMSQTEYNYSYSKEDEFDFDIWLDGREVLEHDLDFGIEFDEYEIIEKIEK